MNQYEKAVELRRLHSDPDILVLVNVWDVASAQTVASLPGSRAIATASAAIAASLGYPDHEGTPAHLMLDAVERIASAVTLPVTADLEAGYGDVAGTVRRAVQVGVVGANLEDAMRPLDASVAIVRQTLAAADQEGVPLVLNARTDVYLRQEGRTPEELFREAVRRGMAYLDAGADCVFVPGCDDPETLARIVDALGTRKVSVLGQPGMPPPDDLAALGVARVSYGPYPHRLVMDGLGRTASAVLDGGRTPWTAE